MQDQDKIAAIDILSSPAHEGKNPDSASTLTHGPSETFSQNGCTGDAGEQLGPQSNDNKMLGKRLRTMAGRGDVS